MKRRLQIIFLLLIVLVGAVGYWALYTPEQLENTILYGNIDVRQVDIGFRVGGRILEMPYEEGDFVQKGSLLGIISAEPYQDRVREAEAHAASLKLSLKNAEQILQRRRDLIASGGVSQEDVENAQTTQEVYGANLRQAEASLGAALTNLHDTKVYAPVDGIILTRIREPGSVVKEADPIYTLSITSPVWVRAYVNEPELGLIYPGMAAEVHTDTPLGKVYQGHIGFISPVAEFTPKIVQTTQIRTDLVYRIRIYIDNHDKYLKQGMPVTVKLVSNRDDQSAAK